MSQVSLRPADETDRWRVFAWKNAPENVAISASRQPVTREQHDAWYTATIAHRDRLLFIVEPGASGMLRLDRAGETAWISVYLEPEARDKGIGSHVIAIGSAVAFRAWPIREVRAKIRSENAASVRAFTRAGFHDTGENIRGQLRYFACQTPNREIQHSGAK